MEKLSDLIKTQNQIIPIIDSATVEDKWYESHWFYGRRFKKEVGELCKQKIEYIIEILNTNPNLLADNCLPSIEFYLKMFSHQRSHLYNIVTIDEQIYKKLLIDQDDIPLNILADYYYETRFFAKAGDIINFKIKINNNKAIFDQCILHFSIRAYAPYDPQAYMNISVEIPFLPYDAKYVGSKKIIHTENNKYFERNDVGKILKVHPDVANKVIAWFKNICESISMQDEKGKRMCSYEEIKSKIQSGQINKQKKYQVYELTNEDCNLDISYDVISIILQHLRLDKCKIYSKESLFEGCTFEISMKLGSFYDHALFITIE